MRLLLLLPVLAAVGCIIAAFIPVRKGRIAHPVCTMGTVVGKRTQRVYRNHSETEAYAPVVRYETTQGEIVSASRYYLPDWQYHRRTGDRVKVCYDRTQPDLFCLCDESSHWRKITLLTFGIGTLVAYAVLWVQYV